MGYLARGRVGLGTLDNGVAMNTMLFSAMLLAVDAPAKGAPAQEPLGGTGMLIPMLLIFGLFIYMFVSARRTQEKARRDRLLAAMKKNDRVLTAAGIYGVVTNVHREANEVTIKVDEATNAKLRMTLSSIAEVLGDEPTEETTNNRCGDASRPITPSIARNPLLWLRSFSFC